MADFLLLLDSPFISLMHLQQNWDYGTGFKKFIPTINGKYTAGKGKTDFTRPRS